VTRVDGRQRTLGRCADALRRIDSAGIIRSPASQLREPSLDDVFLNFTGHKAEDEVVPEKPTVADARVERRKDHDAPEYASGRPHHAPSPSLGIRDVLDVGATQPLGPLSHSHAIVFMVIQPMMFVLLVSLRLRRLGSFTIPRFPT
jgi:hypothetical protein